MSVTRSSALAAALALAACQTREVEVRPFRIQVVDAATGESVSAAATGPEQLRVFGVASRGADGSVTVEVQDPPGFGTLTIRFDPVEPVVVPQAVSAGTVGLLVVYDPAARGPGGEPLPIRGLRLEDAQGRPRFFIGEGDLREPSGIPAVPRPLNPESLAEDGDVPLLSVVSPNLAFEPSDCGDSYYDWLRVEGLGVIELERGERATVKLARQDLPDWTVLHVDSWHRTRDGDGDGCATRLDAWFQAAGWR